MTAQRWPRCASAVGREPATSARPPVLANPTTSEAARRTFRGGGSLTAVLWNCGARLRKIGYDEPTRAATGPGRRGDDVTIQLLDKRESRIKAMFGSIAPRYDLL